MYRRLQEAGARGARMAAPEEDLSSTNPYFTATGEQVKRAAMRYIQIPQWRVAAKARVAFSESIDPDMLYYGCSVTSRRFTAAQVCDSLMDCA